MFKGSFYSRNHFYFHLKLSSFLFCTSPNIFLEQWLVVFRVTRPTLRKCPDSRFFSSVKRKRNIFCSKIILCYCLFLWSESCISLTMYLCMVLSLASVNNHGVQNVQRNVHKKFWPSYPQFFFGLDLNTTFLLDLRLTSWLLFIECTMT
jgi:hypothetical protein